ncbi:hypothetical protein O1611_g4716 [Lasiodiplodia mahajangana]|uniref:Uncharacterized protein n=1 Tax=Lasiodiplodia mahajangana TaxID=1108764 RepID=A0ACC2JN20_9PEZI|nr:hypothetical protein O1611_g4716 [Lasiodiplodia mahajangana]
MASPRPLDGYRRLRGNIDAADADVAVINDCPYLIKMLFDHNDDMAVPLNPTWLLESGETQLGRAKAGNLWQSSFIAHFLDGRTMKIYLGLGPIFETRATPEIFPDGKAAALLAPSKPLNTGTDYFFWFFNGPGVLPPLINSAIQANLPAMLDALAYNPQTIHINDDISVTIEGAKIDPSQVQCVYAACLHNPTPEGSRNVNTILRIGSGVVLGSLKLGGNTGKVSLSVKDLMIYVQAQVYLQYNVTTNKVEGKVLVTRLQCSLQDYNISGDNSILPYIKLWFPILETIGTPYRMAAAINTIFNTKIIDYINSKLSPPKPPFALGIASALGFVFPTIAIPPSPPPLRLPRFSSSFDTTTWMSDPRIQAKTLADLKLPGTHDSATCDLSSVLSTQKYPNIIDLWYLKEGSAPSHDGKWPFTIPPTEENPLYLGKALYDYVMGVGVNMISRTQGMTIFQQLQAGIRYFDFRVYYDDRDGKFYVHHALRGIAFRQVLSQIADFFFKHPNSSELVFAVISHTNFSSYVDKIPIFVAEIKAILSSNVFWLPSPPEEPINFQSLAGVPVGKITMGKSKVMFINNDVGAGSITKWYCPDYVTNTAGYAATDWSSDLYTPEQLAEREGTALQKHTDSLWSVSWSLAADVPTIIESNLVRLTGVEQWPLREIATKANTALRGFLDKYGGANARFNVVTVDWAECCDSEEKVPEMIIRMNYEKKSRFVSRL